MSEPELWKQTLPSPNWISARVAARYGLVAVLFDEAVERGQAALNGILRDLDAPVVLDFETLLLAALGEGT